MDTLLSRLAQSVTGADDLESLTRPMLELLEAVTGLESTYLTRVDQGRGVQHILYSRNSQQMQIPEGLSVPWGDTLCKRALEENRAYTDDVAGCWGESDAARELGIRTYLSQPIRHLDGELYGTLCAASAERVAVAPETVRVLTMFAQLIAHQVEREQLVNLLRRDNAQLSEHALLDPLTGVANRRALIQTLQRLLAQTQRDGSSVQVGFLDLNGFKKINDQHGHEIGDRFLVQIASRLASGVRSGDFVARYGGDEFVVLTPGAGAADLRERLEALVRGRYTLGSIVLDYEGAAVGVVHSEPGDVDAERLLARADAAMYAAKKSRRH
ncbi:MAG TPA: sensor domain-containing diguanylate cyclase [Solimonas sp.]